MFAKTFRNTLIASSLLIGASLLAGPAAMAQVSSDPGAVDGVVQGVSTIVFTPTVGTPIVSGAAVAAYPIGSLTVQDNATLGWTLTVQSEESGYLVNTTNALESIQYTALTTADMGASQSAEVTFTDAVTEEELHDSPYDALVAGTVSNVPVTAAIAAGQFVPVGTYADTLTFTLTSK